SQIQPPNYQTTVPFNITNGSGLNDQLLNNRKNPDPLLNNGNIPVAWKARQLMARHLYALIMLFSDQGFVDWITQGTQPKSPVPPLWAAQKQELTARRVAQWAINVVCFRDSTSAMTPFEYQTDIFQPSYKGWLVDGDPGTDETNPPPGSGLTQNSGRRV